jgi:hypothetical protein
VKREAAKETTANQGESAWSYPTFQGLIPAPSPYTLNAPLTNRQVFGPSDDDAFGRALLDSISDSYSWDFSNNSLYVETARESRKEVNGGGVGSSSQEQVSVLNRHLIHNPRSDPLTLRSRARDFLFGSQYRLIDNAYQKSLGSS